MKMIDAIAGPQSYKPLNPSCKKITITKREADSFL